MNGYRLTPGVSEKSVDHIAKLAPASEAGDVKVDYAGTFDKHS